MIRTIALAVLALSASPVVAQTAPSSWTVAAKPGLPPVMRRTLRMMTITYRAVPGKEDAFSVTITGCNGSEWKGENAVTPNGDTPVERADDAAVAIGGVINDAAGACSLSSSVEDEIMKGFGTAYAKFEAMKQK